MKSEEAVELNQVCISGVPGFPGDSDGKESTYNAGDLSSIPGLGRSPGEGNGNPLQYSCLENPMYRGAMDGNYSPWGRKQLDMIEPLHFHFHEALYSC